MLSTWHPLMLDDIPLNFARKGYEKKLLMKNICHNAYRNFNGQMDVNMQVCKPGWQFDGQTGSNPITEKLPLWSMEEYRRNKPGGLIGSKVIKIVEFISRREPWHELSDTMLSRDEDWGLHSNHTEANLTRQGYTGDITWGKRQGLWATEKWSPSFLLSELCS